MKEDIMEEQMIGGPVHEKCAGCNRIVLSGNDEHCNAYIKPSVWFRREGMMCLLHGKFGATKGTDDSDQGKTRAGQQKGRKKRNR